MRVIMIFAWIWALLGSLAGCAVLVSGWSSAESSPQEAAVAGMALAIAVLPYCFARVLSGIQASLRDEDKELEEKRAKLNQEKQESAESS